MSYEPTPNVNTTNRLNRTRSITNIRIPVYHLFKDMCDKHKHKHKLPIRVDEHTLLHILLDSLIEEPGIRYEIVNTDSPLIKLLKYICNIESIELLDTNIYLKALQDLLYMYNGCKDCVTCVKYHTLPNMRNRGILPIFKNVIDYLIEHRPNIVDDNRKIFSVLIQKYYTYIINDNVEFLSNFNVTTIEDIELYRKLYAVEKKAFESLIAINSELRILYIGSGWAAPRYQGSIMYQFPLLLHGYIPDNNIFTEVYKVEFDDHCIFRDTILKKHIRTIDYNDNESPDNVTSYKTYTTSEKFDIIILNTFTADEELYSEYHSFLTVNGCILTYNNHLHAFTEQYIIIEQLKKYSNNVNESNKKKNSNNILNKIKKGLKSEIQLFNKNRRKIQINKTIENIFRMTNSFNEVKYSSSGKYYMFFYNCSDIALLLTGTVNAPQLNAPQSKRSQLNAPPVNAPPVNGSQFKYSEFEALELNSKAFINTDFGGGSKKYIKIKGGKRLLRIGPKGGKYYMKGGNKKYIPSKKLII
jgi:hypothetical protein